MLTAYKHTNRALASSIALLAGAAASAHAQTKSEYFDVPQDFKIKTPNGETIMKALFIYSSSATVKTNDCQKSPTDAGQKLFETGGSKTLTSDAFNPIAPNSSATVTNEATITKQKEGEIEGKVRSKGEAKASPLGCGKKGDGSAEASGTAKVKVEGERKDKKGKIVSSGSWEHDNPATGKSPKAVVKDPIVARLLDLTTGEVTEWTLFSLRSTLSGGKTAWDGVTLSSDAANMKLEIELGAAVTLQSGSVLIEVVDGVVVQSLATGMFAGMPWPAVGSLTGFSVPFGPIVIDYDLGGDDTHDLAVEFEFSVAGRKNDAAGLIDPDHAPALVSDLGVGFNLADVSTPAVGDGTLGFGAAAGIVHLAQAVTLPPAIEPVQLSSVEWPVYQIGAPHGVQMPAAFVRVWAGDPMLGGVPIAGDMVTNRLASVGFPNVFRTSIATPQSPLRQVQSLSLDLTWVPPLPPGQTIWIEVAVQGLDGAGGVFSPPSPFADPERDGALQFDVATQTWAQVHDAFSGRAASFPIRVFAQEAGEPACYADCDVNGELAIDDFICFQTLFALVDPAADCDQNGELAIDDFICFQTMFAIGC